MRWSETFIPTMKEAPREAEVVSHKLMLRAGLIQNLSSGLYIYLPLGYRVIEKIKQIIRECLNEEGAIELNMPALQPRAIWEKSGRWDALADLMMRITDREEREFVLGPTHEEIITDLVAKRVHSYRELPLNFYQIQTKFRDEIRPRFGVIRAKEFIMKDGYSFDLDYEGTMRSYERMVRAYFNLFRRMGLPVFAVEADTGAMGDGGKSQEFVALTPIGEDTIVQCPECGYAANLEMAMRRPKIPVESMEAEAPMTEVDTPGAGTIEEVSEFLKINPARMLKTLVYEADGQPVLVVLRGDLEVNDIKLKKHLNCQQLQLADSAMIEKVTGAPVGFAGPVGINKDVRRVYDASILGIENGITGANVIDKHLTGVKPDRDFPLTEAADVAQVVEGDSCHQCNGALNLSKGIEVGHVFYLGSKYTEKLDAKVLNPEGKDTYLEMGCYGIGVSRLVAAIIESHHDDQGISWPVSIAPFEVILVPTHWKDATVMKAAEELYGQLIQAGVDVLLDDRNERPGFKFKDAELIGIPLRITLGPKTLERGAVEWMCRESGDKGDCPVDQVVSWVKEKIEDLKKS